MCPRESSQWFLWCRIYWPWVTSALGHSKSVSWAQAALLIRTNNSRRLLVKASTSFWMGEGYFLASTIPLKLLIKSGNLMKERWWEEVLQCRWDQCAEETQAANQEQILISWTLISLNKALEQSWNYSEAVKSPLMSQKFRYLLHSRIPNDASWHFLTSVTNSVW